MRNSGRVTVSSSTAGLEQSRATPSKTKEIGLLSARSGKKTQEVSQSKKEKKNTNKAEVDVDAGRRHAHNVIQKGFGRRACERVELNTNRTKDRENREEEEYLNGKHKIPGSDVCACGVRTAAKKLEGKMSESKQQKQQQR